MWVRAVSIGLVAGVLGTLGGALGGVLGGAFGGAPARAEDPQPLSKSATTTYQVTFAARACATYADVMANQVRDDIAEGPGRPEKDSVYDAGQAVDPEIEEGSGCEPLPGVPFSLGTGRERKGALSTVAGAAPPVTTVEETDRLDRVGQRSGGPVRGAVTTQLTTEQLALTTKRELWAQGGTPSAPAPAGLSFGVLRCGIDGRTAGNTQWIAFPSGTRHVYCYAYYVRGASSTATLTVKLRTTKAAGYAQRIPFTSSLSQSGRFELTADSSESAFVRLAGQPYSMQPTLPAGWRLADVACAASKSVVDIGTGKADVTLVAGENATCTYALTPPVAPVGLTVRVYAEGGAATFGVTLAPAGTASAVPSASPSAPPARDVGLTATVPSANTAATATGADLATLPAGPYKVTVTPPQADAAQWTLAGATCNGSPVAVQGRSVPVTVAAGAVTDCVLRVIRKQGRLSLKVITEEGVATAGFALLPADTARPGYAATAVTNRGGVAADAQGDLPESLPFGSYLLLPLPPLASADSAWTLTSLGCSPGESGGPDTTAITFSLTPTGAAAECTARYEKVEAAQLRVSMEVDGGGPTRAGPVVLDVVCADGSTGRAVLPLDSDGPVDLPAPLIFAADTTCTVGLGEDSERPAVASLVDETAGGNAPLALPATVAVKVGASGESIAGGAARDMRLAVTLSYRSLTIGEKQKSRGSQFSILPVALVGSGLIGIGAAVLLVMLARRKMGLDEDDDD